MILGSVTLLGWQARVFDAASTVGIQPYKSIELGVCMRCLGVNGWWDMRCAGDLQSI